MIPTLLILGALISSSILFQMGTSRYLIPIPILVLIFIWLTFRVRSLTWTGLQGKTLWDWFQVILIPVVLGIYTIVTTVNMAEQQTIIAKQQTNAMQLQNKIADDQLKSQTLQNYTSIIQDLILHEGLLQSKPGDNVQTIATTQTTLALGQLDESRKRHLLLFIYRSKLISASNAVISLNGADLSGADLYFANLRLADLSGANLIGANLGKAVIRETNLSGAILFDADFTGTDLSGANLSGVNLSEADLITTTLNGADLSGADLTRAIVTNEQLKQAKSLQGATMPDGSKHP